MLINWISGRRTDVFDKGESTDHRAKNGDAGKLIVADGEHPGDGRAVLLACSPYQNIQPQTRYPKPLFRTSTGDDRVTPAHARKMAAKMAAAGQPYLFYETAAGGHATPASSDDEANGQALQWVYLNQQLMGDSGVSR